MSQAVWERPEPSGRAALAPLSRDRIVAAAMRLADDDGLDAVSLRKVAAALDAGPMRLYGYVDSKEELLALLVDAVHAEAWAPPRGRWDDVLRDQARRTRAAALRHPWFADLLGGRPHLGPAALDHLEITLAALSEAGAPAWAARLWNAHLVGAIRLEVAERGAAADGDDERAWQKRNGPYLARVLTTGRYPALAALVAADHQDDELAFLAGLDHLLAGFVRTTH